MQRLLCSNLAIKRTSFANFKRLRQVKFPEPQNVRINMMPIVIGDTSSIPPEYRQYAALVNDCPVASSEVGQVGYLSIQESSVPQGSTQRRPGIHTEKHPGGPWGAGWGGGRVHADGYVGVFMASTTPHSCRIWNRHVVLPGHMGDCEHLRGLLGNGETLDANELVWLSDSCPHEALPTTKPLFRQWFRLVTSDVWIWYEKHSTPNRLGVKPNCNVFKGDKFEQLEKVSG